MAQEVIGAKLEITGEATYRAKLNQAALALRNVASQEKVLSAQYGASDRSLAKLTQAMGLLQSKLDAQKAKLAAVKAEYDRVVASEGASSEKAQKLAIDYNYAAAAAETTSRQIRELDDEIKAGTQATGAHTDAVQKNAAVLQKNKKETDASADALKKHEEKLKASKKAWGDFGEAVSKGAQKVAKAAAVMTAAVLTASVKGFLEFEDSMAIVSTIADTTTTSLDDLSDATLEASDRLGVAATELTSAEYDAISSGVDTAQAVGFVEIAAKAAKAGLSDTTSVVKASTAIINAWGYAWTDAESIMDKLIVTQNVGVTTVDQLSGSIGNLTGLAPQLNIRLDEVLAATAALTKNGYSTSKSMTALQGIMTAVLKPSSEATELAKSLGLQFDATAMQAKGLTGFLADVLDKTKGDATQLAVLFGQVEGLSGVMSLAGSAADDYADSLAQIENSAGVLNQTYAARTDSLAQKLTVALNKMKNAAIRFGQTLAPYIEIAANSLEKLSNVLGNLSAEEQMGILKTAAWVIGIASVIAVAGKLIATFKTVGMLLSGPAGWVVLGIAAVLALGAAFVAAANEGDELDRQWKKIVGHTDEKTIAELSAKINVDATVEGFEDAQARVQEIKDWLNELAVDGILTPTEVTNIENALDGDYASIAAALISLGVPEDAATQVSDQVDAAKRSVHDVLVAINPALTDDEIAQVVSLVGKPADEVKAGLLAFGFTEDSPEYQDMLTAITDANELVDTAFAGVEGVSQNTLDTIEASCGDDRDAVIAALKSLGLSDADAYRIAIEMTSKSKILDAGIQSMYDDVSKTLTDGLKDDPATIQALKDKVHDKFQTLMDAVDDQASTEIAAIDPTDPDYDAKVQKILSDAAATKAALQGYENDYYSFIDTYAGKSAQTVQEHLDELTALNDGIAAAIQYIKDSENEVLNSGHTAFELTAGGRALDNDTIGSGFNYAIAKKNTGIADLEEQYKADIADLQAKFASGEITGKDYSIQETLLKSVLGDDKQAIIDEYQQNLQDLFDGIAKASGNADWGDEIVRKLNARDMLQGIMDQMTNGTFDPSSVDTSGLKDALTAVYGDPDLVSQYMDQILSNDVLASSTVQGMLNNVNGQLETDLKDQDMPDVLKQWFDTLMGDGAFEGIDTSSTEAQIKLVSGNLGTAAVDGYAQSLTDNGYKAKDAANDLGKDILDEWRVAQEIRSPSHATYRMGVNTIDGYINGLNARAGFLYSTIRTIAAKTLATMRQELDQHSPSRKTYAIGLNTAQGYINAIYDKIADVQTATRRMVSVDGMQGGTQATASTAQAATARGGDTYNIRYSAPLGRNEVNRFSRTLETVRRDAVTATGRKP